MQSDVLVVGGGPAGIATAIAATLKGLRVTVIDARTPPIDKACGEGLLPEAVAALSRLGVGLNSSVAYPFSGFRFLDESSFASALFQTGKAFGLRRTVLHSLLLERATALGVTFRWQTRFSHFDSRGAQTSAGWIPCRWIVGADGQSSRVRHHAGLDSHHLPNFRFGFRRHYEIAPWTDYVEVHWGEKCQMVIAPTAPREICISLFTSDPHVRLERDLDLFPAVAERLAGVRPSSSERGAMMLLSCARAVVRNNIALVGDASCTVDGIAGEGLTLALQQALKLGDALAAGDLAQYARAHRRLIRTPVRMTRLLLTMNVSSLLRRKVLRLFAAQQHMFAKMISIHSRELTPDALRLADVLNLGWRVLWA